jgi:hypothetical protein
VNTASSNAAASAATSNAATWGVLGFLFGSMVSDAAEASDAEEKAE